MSKSILSASILSADFSKLGNEISQCESAGCDWIHIDVMDAILYRILQWGIHRRNLSPNQQTSSRCAFDDR